MMERFYRLALRAFPKRHRDRYRVEMIDAFNRALDDQRHSGPGAAQRFVVAACLDAIAHGIAERRRSHVVRFGNAFSSLDFLLAWRMLLRYPGLSLVSVFGMAVGIAVATTAFTVVGMLMDTRLPLPEGDRVVSLVTVDTAVNSPEYRLARDYATWREMASMRDLGISREVTRNLIIEGHTPEPI